MKAICKEQCFIRLSQLKYNSFRKYFWIPQLRRIYFPLWATKAFSLYLNYRSYAIGLKKLDGLTSKSWTLSISLMDLQCYTVHNLQLIEVYWIGNCALCLPVSLTLPSSINCCSCIFLHFLFWVFCLYWFKSWQYWTLLESCDPSKQWWLKKCPHPLCSQYDLGKNQRYFLVYLWQS